MIKRNTLLIYAFLCLLIIGCTSTEPVEDTTPNVQPTLEKQLHSTTDLKEKQEILVKLSREYARKDLDIALNYANEALHLADSLQFKKGIGHALARKGRVVSFQGKGEEGIQLYRQAIQLFIETEELDGHAEALNDVGSIYLNQSTFDSAMVYLQASLELAKRAGNDLIQANALGNLANIQNYLGDYPEALESYKACLVQLEKVDNTRGMSICNANMGTIYAAQGDYLSAIQHYQTAQQIDEKRDDSLGMAYNAINIGGIYFSLNDHEKSVLELKKALDIAERQGDQRATAYALKDLALNFIQQGKLEEALSLQNRHLDISRQLKERVGEAQGLLQIGLIFFKQAQFERAKSKFIECQEICLELGNKELLASASVQLAKLSKRNEEWMTGTAYARQAYRIAEDSRNLLTKNDAAELLAFFNEKRGNFEQAIVWQKVCKETKDTLLNEEKIKAIAALDLEFQFEKRQLENQAKLELLETENKVKEEQLNRQNHNLLLLIILVVAIAILLWFVSYLYFFNRRKHNQLNILTSKLEETNQELNQKNQQLSSSNLRQKEAIEMLENFAAAAAHDMKAPLRLAGSFASLLQARHQALWNEKEREYWTIILSNIKTMSKWIDDLLAFSKLGQNLPAPEPMDIQIMLQSLLPILEEDLDKLKGEIEYPKTSLVLDAHPSLIRQLFQNLLSNAIKFSKQDIPPQIQISWDAQKNNWARFTISDNGIGIAEENQQKVFELFNRLKTAQNTSADGAGIGLATCKKIVEYYGGNIFMASELYVGTTISFQLPLSSNANKNQIHSIEP